MLRRLFLFLLFPLVSLFCIEGIEYYLIEVPNTSYMSTITNNQRIHVIEFDPSLFDIKLVKAIDNGLGRESVMSLSKRHNAVASINGGFFSIGGTYDGRACGALKINEWVALPTKPRGCIGWSCSQKSPIMDRLLVNIFIENDSFKIPVNGLNRMQKEGEIILFNHSFNRTTLTDPDGEELLIVDGVIQSIKQGGSSKIPENGYILSIQKNNPFFQKFQVGSSLEFKTEIKPLLQLTTEDEWQSSNYILGGTPLLIHNHTKILDLESEQTIPTFLSHRHARTAIGILPSGNWLFVVVDHTTPFDGMTIPELTQLMEEFGCKQALNLDGGGSSTMVLEGTLKNSPRGDKDEGLEDAQIRRVSDAIVIIPKDNKK